MGQGRRDAGDELPRMVLGEKEEARKEDKGIEKLPISMNKLLINT